MIRSPAFLRGMLSALILSWGLGAPVHAKKRGLAEDSASPPKFELLGIFEIPGTEEFQGTRVGGLSGLVWDESQNIFWAVSDDRGRVSEPRVYGLELRLPVKAGAPSWKLTRLVTLKDPKVDPKKKKSVWDFEGISLLPWGNWLIVSEGDMNQKPRVNSRVMEFKLTGEFVRDYDVPADYLAPATGRQKTGPRNNFSFEGLSKAGSEDRWVVASELGLIQDQGETTRFLEYAQTEAWVLKPGREWFYPLAPVAASEAVGGGAATPTTRVAARATSESEVAAPKSAGKGTDARPSDSAALAARTLLTGVSEILHARDDEWWVLERGAGLSMSGLSFSGALFSVELGANQELKKTPVLDLTALDQRLSRNFEAMSWGPKLSDGRRLLVLLSDNNLEKSEPTVILSLAVTWPEPATATEAAE